MAGGVNADMGEVRNAVEAFLPLRKSELMAQHPQAKLWMLAMSYVAMDITMGLTAKWRDALLIAIFPATLRLEDGKLHASPIDLPGGAIGGFAGFMSKVNRQYECRLAQSCLGKL